MTNSNSLLAKAASRPASTVSGRYAFVPTTTVHTLLADYGFREDKYTQRRERSPERAGYQRHISILQRDVDTDANGSFNLLLLNSHDGSSALHLEAGYFRILCENQLGHGDVGIRVRHTGDMLSKLERAIPQIIGQMEDFKQLVAQMRGKPISLEQVDILVRKALELRGLPNIAENHVKMQLMRRREERDAWSVFNAIQENTIRGGLRFYTFAGSGKDKQDAEQLNYRLLRPITAADRLLEANRMLTRTAHEILNVA